MHSTFYILSLPAVGRDWHEQHVKVRFEKWNIKLQDQYSLITVISLGIPIFLRIQASTKDILAGMQVHSSPGFWAGWCAYYMLSHTRDLYVVGGVQICYYIS